MVLAAYMDQSALTGELFIDGRQSGAAEVIGLLGYAVGKIDVNPCMLLEYTIASIPSTTKRFNGTVPRSSESANSQSHSSPFLLANSRSNPAKHPSQQLGNLESVPCAPRQLAVVETFEDDPLPLVTPLYSWQTFLETPQEPLMVAVSP